MEQKVEPEVLNRLTMPALVGKEKFVLKELCQLAIIFWVWFKVSVMTYLVQNT